MQLRHLAILAVSIILTGCEQQVLQDMLSNRSAAVDVRSSIVDPTGVNQLLGDSQADEATFDLQVSLAGVAWDREILHWDTIQPQLLNYQWHSTDAMFAKAEKAGVQVLPVLTNCTSWGRRDIFKFVENKTIQVPNEVHWKNFVRGAVERYRTRTKVWEIWNRPDDYKQFGGTAEDYVGMLRTAYIEARKNDPDCLVLMGSVADSNWFDSALTFGAAKYCDIFAIQLQGFVPEQYKLSQINEKLAEKAKDQDALQKAEIPEVAPFDEAAALADFQRQLNEFLSAMARHNVKKPIWITSIGLHPAPAVLQASFLCKLYATALANGVDCIFWDRLTSQSNGNVAAGLLYPDLSLRPAGNAYATVSNLLADVMEAKQQPADDGVAVYEFTGLTQRMFVAWAAKEGIVTLPQECKKLYNMFGKEIPLTDEQKAGGKIKVGTQPVYITADFVKKQPPKVRPAVTTKSRIKDNSF